MGNKKVAKEVANLISDNDCSQCIAYNCRECMEETYCEILEEACSICKETEDKEEIKDLLERIEECQKESNQPLSQNRFDDLDCTAIEENTGHSVY